MTKLEKKFMMVKEELATWGGKSLVIEDLKKISNIDELQKYIDDFDKIFWVETTKLAKQLTETLTKLGEEVIKKEVMKKEKEEKNE